MSPSEDIDLPAGSFSMWIRQNNRTFWVWSDGSTSVTLPYEENEMIVVSWVGGDWRLPNREVMHMPRTWQLAIYTTGE